MRVEVARGRRLPQEHFAGLDQGESGDVAVVARVAAGGGAVVAQAIEQLGQPRQLGGKVGSLHRSRNGVDVVAFAEHAPRAGRQRVHVVELHAGAQQARQPAPRVGLTGYALTRVIPTGVGFVPADGAVVGLVCDAARHLGQPLVPQAGALDLGAQRVELLECRIDAGLDGELAQQSAGEAVDGADGGVVERVERCLDGGRFV